MEKMEKCPYCGAWRFVKDLVNHIGACLLYKIVVPLTPSGKSTTK